MNPEISVIIPAYNHEQYIAAALDSLLSQSFRSFEVVVIDDGSTDGTWDVISRYAGKDSRIRAFRQENSGVAVTSQRAMELCRGDWLTFCGSDDSFPPDALALLAKKRKGCDLIIAEYETATDDGKYRRIRLPHTKDLPGLVYRSGALWAKLFRRQFIIDNNIRFPELRLEEDTVFLSELLKAQPRFRVQRSSTYYYWEHSRGPASLSRTISLPLFSDRAQGKRLALENMKAAGCEKAYRRYYLMYAQQLAMQLRTMFDKGEDREAAYNIFKDFILISDRSGNEEGFRLLTGMTPECFRQSDFAEYLARYLASDSRDTVADMYAIGQSGMKYILKYTVLWAKFKLGKREADRNGN